MNGSLVVPALRAAMGDWVYYVTTMPIREVGGRVRPAEEIHKSTALRELIQRSLTDRAGEISTYLLSHPQRFFNAIIGGIYEGAPEWFGIEVGGNSTVPLDEIPDNVKESVGILKLTGQEKIFAIDGQHRAEGVRLALAESKKLDGDELTVILVAHRNTKDGLERTRRLFTTLNRYAKAVTPGEIVALDEDHAMAIITRRLLESHGLLSRKDIVITTKGKSIPRSNKTCFTSILAIYECMNILLAPPKSDTTCRPSDSKLNEYYRRATHYWQLLETHFEPLRQLKSGGSTAGDYRTTEGGHLLFRPVGQLAIAAAVKAAERVGKEWDWSVSRIARLPMELSGPPWTGLLWEPGTKRMRVREDRKKLTTQLLLHMMGLKLKELDISPKDLRESYAAALNKRPRQVTLPPPVGA